MRKSMAAAAFAASVAVAAPAAAEQVYYCSSELGTGIAKDARTGRWKTNPFENIRFTMKFGEMTKGSYPFQNRDLVVSRNGLQYNFICSYVDAEIYRCVDTSSPDIAGFFADTPNPNATILYSGFLITNLKRFEYYMGDSFKFDERFNRSSALYAGTCETF